MTPVAGDRALEMAARFLGIRFNQLERRPAPFTHCDLFASPNRGSLNVDQSCYNLGVEPSVRNKNLPGDALVAEVTPDRVRHALGSSSMSHIALDRMLRRGLGTWDRVLLASRILALPP